MARRLNDHVAAVVDNIGVIANATGHRIGPGTAIQNVVARITGQGVGQGVTRAIKVGRAGQQQGLDIVTEHKAGRGLNRIGALAGQFGDDIEAAVDQIGVIALATGHRVIAGATINDIDAIVTGDDVGQTIACGIQICRTRQQQVFKVQAQRIGNGTAHRVGTSVQGLIDHIACVIDQIGVIAQTTGHRIGAGTTIQHVIAAVAGQAVSQRITAAVDGRCTGQGQIFKVGTQGPGDAGLHGVIALIGQFGDDIAGVIDHIGVITGAADQCVGPQTTIQPVGSCVAGDAVVTAVSRAVDGRSTQQNQVLDVAAQHIAGRGADCVVTFTSIFGDDIIGVVDDIGVVTLAADQGIGAGTAVDIVVAVVTGDDVGQGIARAVDVGCAGQHQVFQVRTQHPVERGPHGVGAASDVFGDYIAGVIDHIGVVTRAANQGVGTGATVQGVVAVKTRQHVVG